MPTSILIVFHSSEGHTGTIAGRIQDRATAGGALVTIDTADAAPDPTGFDAVVLGDSIHSGHHSDEMIAFATRHRSVLNATVCAAFQVSLTSARDDDECAEAAAVMMSEFSTAAGIEPDCVGLFAGALAFSRYRGMERFFMQHVAREAGLDPDVSLDHDYTNWAAVDAFADAVVRLAGRSADLAEAGRGTVPVVTVPFTAPNTPLRSVVEQMCAESASAVLVRSDDIDPLCTEGRRGVLGIVTERDVVEAIQGNANIDDLSAADAMSVDLITVSRKAPAAVMAAAMIAGHFRHLALTDGGAVVGVVGCEDLLPAMNRPLSPA